MGMKPTTGTCDGPIENLIGTAYDIVKNVYDNIPLLQSLDETITTGGPAIIAAGELALSSSIVAVNAANESEASAVIATTKAEEANTSAVAALVSETNAATSELNASNSAAEALANKELTDIKAAEAVAAADNAIAAQDDVAANALAAEVSEANALASENAAALSELNAASSETAAEVSATTATNAATEALDSSVIAVAAKDAALISETNAATSESNAEASATAAATSETNAAASATSALDSRDQAIASAENAAVSEAGALASYQAFQGQYYGTSAIEPTTDPLGNPMGEGDLYFDSVLKSLKVYNGSNWQLASTTIEGIYVVDEYTNIAGQTTFNITYDVGLIQVLYNGVQLSLSDFVATNSTSVVLNAPVAKADDVITLVRWGAVTESSVVKETPDALSIVKRTSTGAGRFANAVNADEAVVLGQLGNAASKTIGSGVGEVPDKAVLDTRLGTSGNLGNAALSTVTTIKNDKTPNRLLKVGDFGLGGAIEGVNVRSYDGVGFLSGGAGNLLSGAPDLGFGNAIKIGHPTEPNEYYAAIYRAHNQEKWYVTGSYGQGPQSWRELYHQGNVLGPVGVAAGGTPNSAIIERGSNANGQYVKFADGTQICWHAQAASGGISVAAGSIFRTDNNVWNYPAVFSSSHPVAFSVTESAGVGRCWGGLGTAGVTSSNASFTLFSAAITGSIAVASLTAVGRWF